MTYDDFIASKLVTANPVGFEPEPFVVPLFHFQRDVTDFLIRIGRGAAFLAGRGRPVRGRCRMTPASQAGDSTFRSSTDVRLGAERAAALAPAFDLDAMCIEALARLQASTEARIERFREASKQQYHFAIRSIAQKARRLREVTEREFSAL